MARTAMTQAKALGWLSTIETRRTRIARMNRLKARLEEVEDAEGIADCTDAIARYEADITHISSKLTTAVLKASATLDVDSFVRANLSVFPVK